MFQAFDDIGCAARRNLKIFTLKIQAGITVFTQGKLLAIHVENRTAIVVFLLPVGRSFISSRRIGRHINVFKAIGYWPNSRAQIRSVCSVVDWWNLWQHI